MNKIFYLLAIFVIVLTACQHKHETEKHEEHKEAKIQFTAYSNEFELFAEADPFVTGKTSNVLSHFSHLPDFKAFESGSMTLRLVVNGKECKQNLDKPTRKGIFSFDIKPETAGTGHIIYDIKTKKGNFEIKVPNIIVYKTEEEADEAAEKIVISKTNTSVFTKEQSWKIDFATSFPSSEAFGQVIKTTAIVQSAQSNEFIITAKNNGIVIYNSDVLIDGKEVSAGQSLFSVTGGNMADNNIALKYSEAKSNYEKANADYERIMDLAKDKIVSEKDLISAKNQYKNSKAIYENLSKNFNSTGQTIKSPQSGYIKQIFVKNGAYVEAGQTVAVVSQNKSLVLTADVPSKYAPVLPNIKTANIRAINDKHTYSLEQLNGKILSYGKAANSDNYLIPLTLQLENNGSFISGSYVEIYLKTYSTNQVLVVPTTSLMEEQGNFFVWVQLNPELFEKREVFIGGTDGINTEIKKGIAANERIVSRGAMLIKLAQATGTLDAHSGHVH